MYSSVVERFLWKPDWEIAEARQRGKLIRAARPDARRCGKMEEEDDEGGAPMTMEEEDDEGGAPMRPEARSSPLTHFLWACSQRIIYLSPPLPFSLSPP